MAQPLIGVVIPNYNMASTLPTCLDSIVKRSRPPDEVVIVDDGSTDDSVAIIESYARKHPYIRLIRHERNQGFSAAAATGLDAARARFVHSFAADDETLPGFYEGAAELALAHPDAGAICGQLLAIEESGRRELRVVRAWREPCFASPERFCREYLDRETSTHSLSTATIFRLEAMREVGGHRPELGYVSDHWAFRAVGMKYGIGYLPFPCAIFRKRDSSVGGRAANDIRHRLDVFGRVAYLMRSPEFAQYFPADHTRDWYRRVVWRSVIRHAWFSLKAGKLIDALTAPRWLMYQPDLSCYSGASTER